MGDDAQAVVYDTAKTRRTSLQELHLAVECLGDPDVAGETSHAGDRFDPVIEGAYERLQRSDLILPQVADGC